MQLYLLLLTTVALVTRDATAASSGCTYYQDVVPGQTYEVKPSYSGDYPAGADCSWTAVTTSNSKFILTCNVFNLPKTTNCAEDRFSVSPSGDSSMTDAHVYCGTGTFTVQSTTNRILMTLTAPYSSKGGNFKCSLTTTTPPTQAPAMCDCGWKKEPRIVNGHETGVNEYPMMAALIDFQIRELFCGTTIIARRYTMSAAHCLLNKQTDMTGVLVGDHDISTGTETNSAKILRTERFQAHPSYNSATQENDIAIIRVTTDIVFSLQVGPACLPFRFPTTSVGTVVNVLGWGTLEYTGAKSDRLMETQLDIVDTSRCQQTFGSKVSTTNQLCTYRSGTDACQADSGGPLLWMGPGDRVQVLGVISYSKGCATQYPGVNTRVFPYLSWIMSVTPDAQYCVR